jgi:DNA-binding HxlR family transcriptional regulator
VNGSDLDPFCPYYQRAIELIGGRWTGSILRCLTTGLYRFSDIRQTIPGLSDRMLSERLKELESEGLVERRVIPETPVRVEYILTEKGASLGQVMLTIAGWAEVWLPVEVSVGATH